MAIRRLFVFLFGSFLISQVNSGSICISTSGLCGSDNPGSAISYPPQIPVTPVVGVGAVVGKSGTIYVDGDLYLDYSIFSAGHDLDASANITVTAETITIFDYLDTPVFPSVSSAYLLQDGESQFEDFGSWVLFSDIPFLVGTFEATGDLYIGNYSSMKPVPAPPAFYLFFSACLLPAWFAMKRRLAKFF